MSARAVLALCGLLSVCAGCAGSAACEEPATMRFYYESVDDYDELPLSAAPAVLAAGWYNRSRPTTILTHGFTGLPDGRAVRALASAFAARGHNVALLAWPCGAAAAGPSYGAAYVNWAVPNALQLGVQFAETLAALGRAGLALGDVRLVGHSLGAHVFGIAGHRLARDGVLLPCIVGLDPSGPGWDNRPAALRLSAGAAAAVLALHTDPDRYGSRLAAGGVDVWPNARATRVQQPGCAPRRSGGGMFSDRDLCSHNRSWQLLADAAARPGSLLAQRARSYRDWRRRAGERDVLDLAGCGEDAVPGNYYLVTGAAAPYGLGAAGLRPRDNGTRARRPPKDEGVTRVSFSLD